MKSAKSHAQHQFESQQPHNRLACSWIQRPWLAHSLSPDWDLAIRLIDNFLSQMDLSCWEWGRIRWSPTADRELPGSWAAMDPLCFHRSRQFRHLPRPFDLAQHPRRFVYDSLGRFLSCFGTPQDCQILKISYTRQVDSAGTSCDCSPSCSLAQAIIERRRILFRLETRYKGVVCE